MTQSTPSHFGFMDPAVDSEEWAHAWAVFGDDPEQLNPEYGEVWQYMGTVTHNGTTRHEFRHRAHPKTGQREYVHVRASIPWATQAIRVGKLKPWG